MEQKSKQLQLLSIVIPVYNERNTILELLSRVQKARAANLKKEIIVVDDCSTDGTPDVLETVRSKEVQVFRHSTNRGKGAALRTGFQHARGDIIVIQDADLEYDPNEYESLIAPIREKNADVVFGSRFSTGNPHRVLYFWHYVGNRFLTSVSNIFTNLNLSDMETCYKVFKRSVLKQLTLKENGFGFEPEITAKVAKIPGISIYEVGISYSGRSYEEGKKIGWRDGFRALYCILKYNLFG
jgi:glycosyltransferase involved in cell wall biosynthesis